MIRQLLSATQKHPVNIVFFFFFLFIALTGCEKEEDPYLSLSVQALDFTDNAGEQTLGIIANVPWQAEISPASASSWLTLSTATGAQSEMLTVSVTQNKKYDNRSAQITFRSAAGTQTLRVTQQEIKALWVDDEKEQFIWQPGGELPVKIRGNVDYTTAVSENAQSWIHLSHTKALVTEELVFYIDENRTGEVRPGEIYIFGKDSVTGAVKPEWSDTIYVWQQELSFTVDRANLEFGESAQRRWVIVNSTHRRWADTTTVSEYTYSVPAEAADWCTVEKSDINEDHLSVSVKENPNAENRSTDITLTSSILTQTIHVEQKGATGGSYYTDGDIVNLQTGRSKSVNLIIMGDGFTINDLKRGGLYETKMQEAAEHFFSVEPFASYRDHFKVDMIVAESEEEGVNDKTGTYPTINNKFGSTFGEGTEITCNQDLCNRYAATVPGIRSAIDSKGNFYIDMPCLVILVVNSTRYAGMTTMYSNGFCIAMVPLSTMPYPNDFEGLIHHEAGGHGFGLFGDEYIYFDFAIPASRKEEIKRWQQSYGFYSNVDFTNDFTRIKWKEFIGREKYPYVNAYEGAFTYAYGIWRPEENTCMDGNIPYFSAPCRLTIINRIKELVGEPLLSVDEFARQDNVTPPVAMKSGVPYRKMPPLAPPRRIEVN